MGSGLGLNRFGWVDINVLWDSFFHLRKLFLSLPYLSQQKLSSLSSVMFFFLMSFPARGKWGSDGGWPAGTAAPPRRNPKLLFFNFFCLISSTIKNFKIWINSPKSIFYIQEEKNETTFWWDRLFDSDRVTVSVSCVSVLVWIREAFGCCGLVCLCSPCRFRLCVDLDRGVCDCDCWVMVLDLIRKRWLVCACDVAGFFCVIFRFFLSVFAGIYNTRIWP